MAKRKSSWQKANDFANRMTPHGVQETRTEWTVKRDYCRFGYQNGFLAGVAMMRRRMRGGSNGTGES